MARRRPRSPRSIMRLEEFESSGQRSGSDAYFTACTPKSFSSKIPQIRLAEEAFLAAIAVARHQKARSFELRAALALAKLYQATAHPAEARAVLAPALEGFATTPEMPEIAEAQALLAALEAGAHVRHE